MTSQRIRLLDLIRGFSIVCMVVYHGVFSLIYLFDLPWDWFDSALLSRAAVPFFGGIFIVISGICSRLSHAPLQRGIQVLVLALLMELVTSIVTPDLVIRFGILHLLGSSMIASTLLRHPAERIPWKIGLFLSIFLFILLYHLPDGYIGLGPLHAELSTHLPYLYALGMPAPHFHSSDYYPLIPWFFIFSAGNFVGQWIQRGQAPDWIYPSRVPWIEWIGRHSLWIYLLHQPILIGVFLLLFWCFR